MKNGGRFYLKPFFFYPIKMQRGLQSVTAKITFILGGTRSGKSSFAINLAKNINGPDSHRHTPTQKNGRVAYLAPGVACDSEMRMRIEKHKKMRPNSWQTIEEPLNIEGALKNLDSSIKCVIFDCLSFWVSNLILHYQNVGTEYNLSLQEKILSRVSQLLGLAKTIKPKLIIVSNEVGMGVVPDAQTGRIFRDILGTANQLVKDSADEVFFLVAGVPIKIK